MLRFFIFFIFFSIINNLHISTEERKRPPDHYLLKHTWVQRHPSDSASYSLVTPSGSSGSLSQVFSEYDLRAAHAIEQVVHSLENVCFDPECVCLNNTQENEW